MSKNSYIKKTSTALITLTALAAPAASATDNLIIDDFSSGSVANHVRFRPNLLDAWGKNNNLGSLWTIDSGALSNAGTTSGVPAEGGVGQVVLVSDKTTDTSLTKVKVSFDYTVGTGSTLYFHLQGLTTNGTPAATEELANPTAQNGGIQNAAETEYGDMSLIDGTDPNNGTGGTESFAAGSSGTYSETFDLTGYTWHADEALNSDGINPGLTGNIGNITDFDYILTAFASNVTDNTGAGAISIENFSLTAIPEPGTYALLAGLTGLAFAMVRRRR